MVRKPALTRNFMTQENTAAFAAKLNESIMANPRRAPSEIISEICSAVASGLPSRNLSADEKPHWLALARQITAHARAGAISPTGSPWRSFKKIFDKLDEVEKRRALNDISTLGSANPGWQNALVAAAVDAGVVDAKAIPRAIGEARKPAESLSEKEVSILLTLSGIQDGAMRAARTQGQCDSRNLAVSIGIASWLSGPMALAETLRAAAAEAPAGEWRSQGFNRHFVKMADIALSAAAESIVIASMADGNEPRKVEGLVKSIKSMRALMSLDEANAFSYALATGGASSEWKAVGSQAIEPTSRESIQEAIDKAIPEAFEPAAPRGWLGVIAARISERKSDSSRAAAPPRRSGP